jgi:23S rRNA (cytosine1962-C5)-methyltransferase
MITLKKNADRRIRKGHLWVFSNEIAQPPVSSLEPGSIHELCDTHGEFMGMVYANPASLITSRLLSRKKVVIDEILISERLSAAFEMRKTFSRERDSYRMVFAESDFLPGLIVDKYSDYLSVQSLTAGMDKLMDFVLECLESIAAPKGIYLRNDSPARGLEGIPLDKRPAFGRAPEIVEISSGGLKFLVNIIEGQKTGFFLDQEFNRGLMKKYVTPGAKVLDLFCYTGAWGIHALGAGAESVTAVDSSRSALEMAVENARQSGFSDRYTALKDSVVDFLKKIKDSWDVVVIDPPAFIKNKGQFKEGWKAYIDVNRRAMGRLRPGGILISCSCSHHMDQASFEEALLAAARQNGREIRILEVRGQGPDHPVLLSMPETRYLKVVTAIVS